MKTKKEIKKEGREIIKNAVTKAQACKGLILLAAAEIPASIASAKERAKLIERAWNKIDRDPINADVYTLSHAKSAIQALVFAHKFNFINF